jgi:hypothetical protein
MAEETPKPVVTETSHEPVVTAKTHDPVVVDKGPQVDHPVASKPVDHAAPKPVEKPVVKPAVAPKPVVTPKVEKPFEAHKDEVEDDELDLTNGAHPGLEDADPKSRLKTEIYQLDNEVEPLPVRTATKSEARPFPQGHMQKNDVHEAEKVVTGPHTAQSHVNQTENRHDPLVQGHHRDHPERAPVVDRRDMPPRPAKHFKK